MTEQTVRRLDACRCYECTGVTRSRKPAAVMTRFWRLVHVEQNGCWRWVGALRTNGYGVFTPVNRRDGVSAHRAAYELLVGPIPDGLTIDHLCRNRACVNPAHLEPVTKRENTLRGVSPPALNIVKTHCVRGHEFTPETTYVYKSGKRTCLTCHTLRRATSKYRAMHAAAERRRRQGMSGCSR